MMPSEASTSRMRSEILSPIQSRFGAFETLKNGRIRYVSAREAELAHTKSTASATLRDIYLLVYCAARGLLRRAQRGTSSRRPKRPPATFPGRGVLPCHGNLVFIGLLRRLFREHETGVRAAQPDELDVCVCSVADGGIVCLASGG